MTIEITNLYTVNWCSPNCYRKHQNPQQIVSTLSFELERRSKPKNDEVGILLQHLYGYNSVCFLKPATLSTLQGRLNLVRIDCCFKNTRHFKQIKQISLNQSQALLLKERRRGFIAHSKHFAYKVKLMRSPYLGLFYVTFYSNKVKAEQKKQVTHTYTLIEAKVFMQATKGNREKIDIINSCSS